MTQALAVKSNHGSRAPAPKFIALGKSTFLKTAPSDFLKTDL
jgi:hypothetical protein